MSLTRPLLAAFALGLFLPACATEGDTPTVATASPQVRVSPSVGGLGMAFTVTLRGINTDWKEGEVTLDLGPDIIVGGVSVIGPNHAEAEVQIGPTAELGFRRMTVGFPDREGEAVVFQRDGDEGFLVESGAIQIAPSRARLGETLEFEIFGFNTIFQDGTWVEMGEGVVVDEVTVIDSTHAIARVSIDQRADPGYHDVIAFNGPNGYTLMDGLFIDRTAVAIEIDPDHGNQGETLYFTVRGHNTHFEQTGFNADAPLVGDRFTIVDLGREICVNEYWPDCQDNTVPGGYVSVTSATQVTGQMQISNGATPGFYDVRAYVLEYTGEVDGVPGIGADEYTIVEDVTLHDGFEVRPVPFDCKDNPGVAFGFNVSRQFDNDSCEIGEGVSAYAVFYQPLDPPCGNPPQMPPPPFDVNGILNPPPAADCPGNRTCDAGPFVYLESELNTIVLQRDVNPYTGDTLYLPATPLTLDDYKFGYVDYDLRAEGSDDPTQIPAFTAEDVLYTLPSDFELLEPQLCQNFTHDPHDDLWLRWTPANTYDVAGLSASYSTADETGQAWVLMTFPWDDGEYQWTSDWWMQMPEGGGNLSFGAGVNEPKWFLDFGAGPVGVENQGGSGLSYSGFMILQSAEDE